MSVSGTGRVYLWIGLLVAVGACSGPGGASSSNPPEQELPGSTSAPGDVTPGESSSAEATERSPTDGSSSSSPIRVDEQNADAEGASNNDTDTIECERQIEFEVIALGEPTPIDVVIVADHSPSLTWSRDDLAAGLSDLIEQVYGSDVRFFVLTPTQYGEHSQAISMMGGAVVDWKDPLTGEPYPNDMTTYVETCSDLSGAPISCPSYPPPSDVEFALAGTFEMRMPEPVAAISRNMSLAELQAQQRAIGDAILDLGLGGSPYEQPLCTLLRYAKQPPEALPERAVFIVLSDEDDVSSPMDCLQGVTYEQHFEPSWVTGCESNCDGTRFMVQAPYADVIQSFTCMPYDDFGNPLLDAAHPVTAYWDPVDACQGVAVGECTREQATVVQTFCAAGERVEDCSIACAPSQVQRPCWVDLEDVAIDACAESFTLGGQTYANVVDYCQKTQPLTNWSDCSRQGLTLDQGAGVGNLRANQCPIRFVADRDPLSLVTAFESSAQTTFGEGNYFVEVIGLSPEFDCPLGAGQSYATNLTTVASSPNDVFPICESYAPALGRIQSYATTSLETEYALSLGELETVSAVYVSDVLGNERELPKDSYHHEFERATLSLVSTALASRDKSLRVAVEVHCEPPVRQVF